MNMSNNVLFEIGVEELPARFIDDAEMQLKSKTELWLQGNRIQYDQILSYSTPRRLAVLIKGMASEQTALVEDVRGPKLNIAKNEEGTWTKAAIGFAKGQQKTTDDIFIRQVKDTDYIFVEKQYENKESLSFMPLFVDVIKALEFPQTMKWGENNTRFARPIRWIVALYNEQVIPLSYANVHATNKSFGHRFLSGETIITDASQYESLLLDNYVIANPKKREEMIVSQFENLEIKHDFKIKTDRQLLNEVRNLVEYPTAFIGEFDSKYLNLPEQVLTTTMKIHQRYFPVSSSEEWLIPYFAGVRNGTEDHIEIVARGNEKVLVARLSDAKFFYEEDKQQSVDAFNDKLKSVVFQEKIGTYSEKVLRVKQISAFISEQLTLNREDTENITRAAEICKFDLVTNMVNEFPELQGVMGEIYAKEFKENEFVATAIREHYLPLHTNGELPSHLYGAIVSIADKIDTIVGCFTANLIPTGSQDPYALRRQALGLLNILKHNNWHISFQEILKYSLSLFEVNNIKIENNLNDFMQQRMKFILREEQIDHDIIAAILHGPLKFVADLSVKAQLLTKNKNNEEFSHVQEAFIRVINLSRKMTEERDFDPTLIETESEKELYLQYDHVQSKLNDSVSMSISEELSLVSTLADYIHQFLDNNLVMSEDEEVKENRLILLHKMAKLILSFADFTDLE